MDVSGEVLEKKILRDGAKQGTRFFLSLYEAKIVLYILPFSLERKRKKQGEPTNGSPLTPFQRPTGQSKDRKARKKIPGAESMIQCKSPGRTGQRAQPAPSR